jgi:hypothetical protein
MPMNEAGGLNIYFSDFFGVTKSQLKKYGAFNISLLADLPLFVDPFLLFNSKKPKYRALHDRIIEYLRFLKEKSSDQSLQRGLLGAWYMFPEIKQNWLGFSGKGNRGHGLGTGFAQALHSNLGKIFGSFGAEKVTKGSHLEKLCLIRAGVGRDNISDFTNNLILAFLLEYTQGFATRFIAPELRRRCTVRRVHFNFETESWEEGSFDLPFNINHNDYVLLTPRELLTRDDTWINKTDLVDDFASIPLAISNEALRAQIDNYFRMMLPREPTRSEEREAAFRTIQQFPQLIDFYIRQKEDTGERAVSISSERLHLSERLYLDQFQGLALLLQEETGFYSNPGKTYREALGRVAFFKDVIENKGGHRFFYIDGSPVEREEDLHILYRMTWYATTSDVTREANDGRGPVDFKISKGSRDKTLVEFKLAKNSHLERNLERQTKVYEKASDAPRSIRVIVYFTEHEREHVEAILKKLNLLGRDDVVLVDARNDNKPSGSKA